MDKRKLQIDQLEVRIKRFDHARELPNPPTGWVRALRMALGMTLQQLANRMGISRQSVRDMEMREREGTITLRALREAANALDMELVYGLVPREGSLEEYIDRRARVLAERIVLRTSTTMKLEDQGNTEERIEKAIEERKQIIKQELPKALWD